uniref:Si:dkey-97o5.1 n=1 Tax=Salarias fasciatus TaxID=181472 RepID=A0A672HNF1_SALFA
MSQTNASLLNEVVQWSQETCRQELKSVLPKLTISSPSQPHSDSWEDHILTLNVLALLFCCYVILHATNCLLFCLCFLPHMQLVTMFDSMLKEIVDQVGGLSSQNTELCDLLRSILQAMMQIIDALSCCVRHIGSFQEAPDLCAIRSLPVCILKVLRETFQHCKDSDAVYCGRLSLVADLLQGLFKEAYSLQKGLLDLLDRISLSSSASEEEVSDIVTVIHSLLDICSIISNLDIALHANTWKFLIKQSLKNQSLVEEHLHHGDISRSLSDNLLSSFQSCVELAGQIQYAGLQETPQSPEVKLFQKTAKMCRFFANTLVHYIKEFKYFLVKHCGSFHQLYLQIISKFPPSISAPALPAGLCEELNAAARVPMDAFLLQLLPLKPFAEVVLQQELQLSPEQELPQCLLLVNIMGQMADQPEEVLQLWHTGSQFSEETPRLPLYQAIFTAFRRCHTERQLPVQLPGVMLKGQAQTQVSLHHHVCVQLCASVAVLPPVYFPMLERCLLDAVLQADTHTALLATDVWCFMARYGTAELCLHHVLLIARLVKLCSAECYQSFHLGFLLKRMVFLMTPNHQVELVTHFPPSKVENLPVWHQVVLRALSRDTHQLVETEIISHAQKVLTDWQNEGYKLGQVEKVVRRFKELVLRGQSSPEEQCVLSAVRIVTQLWLRMNPDQLQVHPVLQCTLQQLLPLSSILVKNMEPEVIAHALSCVEAVVSLKCGDQLLLAALEFLSSLGKIFIPPESQSEILPRLSGLFGFLLADSSWLLHQHALEAFSYFAENTNHEEVISQSLSAEDTKTKVVNYLSKVSNEEVGSRLQRLQQERPTIEQHNEKLECHQCPLPFQLCPKRARQETSSEDEYSRYLQAAESALKALQALAERQAGSTSPPPHWLQSRLQELQALITQISTS